jgi:hypothetical protein
MDGNTRKSVFISGSAYDYGSFGDEGRDFIKKLSKTLLKNGFTIISGFGYGVGNYVVEGALEEMYLEQGERMADRLKVYPFPVHAPLIGRIQERYRNDMIAQAETAIFLFGNKLEDISVREADGMIREFEIARSRKARLIAVGASGYVSAKLWRDVVNSYDDYFETRENFGLYERLGDSATPPQQLIDTIVELAAS